MSQSFAFALQRHTQSCSFFLPFFMKREFFMSEKYSVHDYTVEQILNFIKSNEIAS